MRTLLCAHSGYDGYKDNSIDSITGVLDVNPDYFEVDVRLTKDYIPVICHDDVFDGRSIKNSSADELPDGIARLRQVLEICKPSDIKINFDIKDPRSIPFVAKLIDDFGYSDRHIFTGLDFPLAVLVKKAYRDLTIFLNADNYSVASGQECKYLFRQCIDNNIDGLNLYYLQINKAFLDCKKQFNLPVCVWTVNDIDAIIDLAGKNIDMITTREVSKASKALMDLK